jgi:hypothetical protein
MLLANCIGSCIVIILGDLAVGGMTQSFQFHLNYKIIALLS